jgi:hypothetical protein
MQIQLRPAGVEQLRAWARRPRRLAPVRTLPRTEVAPLDEPIRIGDLERFADLGCLPPRRAARRPPNR